jgi:hypothetical protein
MSRKYIHKYFEREASKWNILDFLNECDIEPFERKIDCYTSSLDIIVNNKEDRGCEKAQKLLEKYRGVREIKILGTSRVVFGRR